ncbi:nectin-4 [Eurytemora carolleeae]|uniref:nectin-4 n=1 Tax=Eurytemora carolleeae TaxID=1294199 RepID=UPI000C78FAD4|nr:nectin-4 [Eurytemora carolleeae]|eukprot:XP_023321779.1 nectin-4-like [Eurytemora affinis]
MTMSDYNDTLVTWWNGTKKLESWDWRVEHENGTGNAKSEINLVLSRYDLGGTLHCRVNSTAVQVPILASVQLNVEIPPLDLVLQPVHQHVDEGGRITLTCTAVQGRPAPYVYWNSEPEIKELKDAKERKQKTNHTYSTTSTVTIKARRELASISCFASNKVMDDKKISHLSRSANLNVKFPPEISRKGRATDEIYKVLNENITLICPYTANPNQVNVSWYRNSELLDFDKFNVKSLSSDNSKITLQNSKSSLSDIVDIVSVYVEDVPNVQLTLFPLKPISENLNENVTLRCAPQLPDKQLISVKWFLDGALLKQLPDCRNRKGENITINCTMKDPGNPEFVN